MKKLITAKRVFAIIGIVMGSVFAFVGAVVGVLAAMGQFSPKIVYPLVLTFENNDQVIIAGRVDQPDYSFVLTGTNPNAKHPVTEKQCYIWFDDIEYEKLITLCDAEGNNLTPISATDGRYIVNCNEPIYYKLKQIENDSTQDNKVVINATSYNQAKAQTPLTIWIDRVVDSVVVKDKGEVTRGATSDTQVINLGVDEVMEFEYSVAPPYSLHPISKESAAKSIELYFSADNDSDDDSYELFDHILVNKTTVQSAPLNSILEYDGDTLRFKSNAEGSYKFIIAVFPTYQAEDDYIAERENETTPERYFNRILKMQRTELTINVQTLDINKVEMHGNDIILNLYNENDIIALTEEAGVSNHLDIYATKSNGISAPAENSLLDSVKFADFESSAMWQAQQAIFTSNSNESVQTTSRKLPTGYSYTLSNVKLGKYGQIISYVTDRDSIKYYCTNGVAVLQNGEIKVLTAGTYLNFFAYTTENEFVLIDNETYSYDYTVTASGSGVQKVWNIISKTNPNESFFNNETLKLGLMYVRNGGQFVVDNYFDTISVNLNPVTLQPTFNAKSYELNVTYPNGVEKFDQLSFANIVNLNDATYDACVFVTEKLAGDNPKYPVNVIPNIEYVVGEGDQAKHYVLVGNNSASGFVNTVQINSNAGATASKVYLLQLKNNYNQTAKDIVDAMLEDGGMLTNAIKLFTDDAVSITAKYILNPEIVSCEYFDTFVSVNSQDNKMSTINNGGVAVYENTKDLAVLVSAGNNIMLKDIYNYYELGNYNIWNNYFAINYPSNMFVTSVELIEITGANDSEYKILIRYETASCLTNVDTIITLNLKNVGNEALLGNFYIKSSSPSQIVFNADSGETLKLSNTVDAAMTDNSNFLRLVVGYNTGYTYSFYAGNSTQILDLNKIFNETITGSTDFGFQDEVFKGKNHAVNYLSLNKEIFNSDNIANLNNFVAEGGTTILQVNVNNTTQYIKVVVDTSAFALATIEDRTSFEYQQQDANSPLELSKVVANYTYNDNPINPSQVNNVYVTDVKCVYFGDGVLTVEGNKNDGYTLNKQDAKGGTITVLEIKPTGTDWEFNRLNNFYTSLTISFVLDSIVEDNLEPNKITVRFTSDVTVDYNNEWANNRTLYAGTKVLLHSTSQTAEPVFSISSNQAATVSFKVNGIAVDTEYSVPSSLIGEIFTIQVYVNNNLIAEYSDFEVKPNIVATYKTENEYFSGTTYNANNIYNLQQYKTDIIYGSTANALYTNTDEVTGNLAQFTGDVIVTTDNATLIEVPDSAAFTIKDMAELGITKSCKIYLYFGKHLGERYLIDTQTITFANSKAVSFNFDLNEYNAETNSYNFNTLKDYELFASVGSLPITNISVSGLEISVDADSFVITSLTNQPYTDVEMVIWFGNTYYLNTVNCDVKFNILPYTPEQTNNEKAYSGVQYDLLTGVYTEESLKENDNIYSLKVNKILDAQGNDITNQVVTDFVKTGYEYGINGASCNVIINEIYGNSKLVYVQYEIVYKNGQTATDVSYLYELPMVIENRQTITVQTPEDLTLNHIEFRFFEQYANDAKFIGGEEELTQTISGKRYEAVLLHTGTSYELDLVNFDSDKKVTRVVVTNEKSTGVAEKDGQVPTVELIAYETVVDIDSYISSKISINNGKVLFGTASAGFYGHLIFKLTTVSGNVDYYYAYMYCSANQTLNIENNFAVVATKNAQPYKEYTTIQIEDGLTYGDIIKNTPVNADIEEKYLAEFGRRYDDNTKLMLLEGTTLGGTFDYKFGGEESLRYTDISDVVVTADAMFNTITLSLVYSGEGIHTYPYGTITIYLQPDVDNETLNGLTAIHYNYPNGEFNKTLDAGASTLVNPFTWANQAKVISLNDETVAISAETEDELFDINGAEITLQMRVIKDTTFVVEYTNGSTYAYVEYTLLKTELPANTTITVGEFDAVTGFKTTLDITSEENVQTFFKSYDLSLGYEVVSVTGPVTESEGVLTFATSHVEQTATISIKYTNMVAENEGDNVRTFTFIVKPGISIAQDGDNTAGLTSVGALATTLTNNYDGETAVTGSTIEVKYTAPELGKPYYTYQVGGLLIYTENSTTLKLMFDDPNSTEDLTYVTDTNDNVVNVANTTTTIGFVHLANNAKLLRVKIEVLNGDDKFADKDFYVNVQPTYKTIKAIYNVEGATHENVTSGQKIENLHTELLANKFELIDIQNNEITADLINMGFSTVGNPNRVSFAVSNGQNGNLINTNTNNPGIQFATVSSSVTTLPTCTLIINNDAGIVENSVNYVYQILPNQGVDYSTSSGVVDEYELEVKDPQKYVAFTLNDTNSSVAFTSERLVIGTAYDLSNKSVFNIDLIKVGEDELQKASYAIKDGKNIDNNSLVIGGYINAIQYVATYGNYTLYITYDFDSNNIELIASRAKTETITDFVFTITASGVNNNGDMFENLEVSINNYTIAEEFGEGKNQSTGIYAEYEINVADYIKVNNYGTNTDDVMFELITSDTYNEDASYYTLSNKTYPVTNEINSLFKYDKTKNTIVLDQVGENVRVSLKFVVKVGNYKLKTVQYNFVINLNWQIVVNGETLEANKGNSNPVTNFVLTTANDITQNNNNVVGTFPISIQIQNNRTVTDKNNYAELVYDLYRLKKQGVNNPTDAQLRLEDPTTAVTLELDKVITSDIVTFNESTNVLTFHKDYTGYLYFDVKVVTENGTYSVRWTIHVTGIMDITYNGEDSVDVDVETLRLDNGGTPFNSGAEVDTISSGNIVGTSTGVLISKSSLFTDKIFIYSEMKADTTGDTLYVKENNYYKEKSKTASGTDTTYKKLEPVVNYQYTINENNTTTSVMTNKQLFENENNLGTSDVLTKYLDASSKFTLNLPQVPTTSDKQSYFVTYKLFVEYLELTSTKAKVFYVTYEVINKQYVGTYTYEEGGVTKSSANVDVDELDNSKLGLFYFKQTAVNPVTNKNVELVYQPKVLNGPVQLLLIDDGTTYEYSNERFIIEDGYYYTLENNNLIYHYEENAESKTATLNLTSVPYNETGNKVVFSSNFTSMAGYMEFINTYLNKDIEDSGTYIQLYESETNKPKFKLEHIANGVYGIDLSTHGTSGVLFSNQMLADLKIYSAGVVTVTLQAHTDKVVGFKLYTNNAITAETNGGAGVELSTIFPLTSYYNSTSLNYFTKSVIGYGEPNVNWINDQSATFKTTTKLAEIVVSDDNKYAINQVTYEVASAEGGLYDLTASFYYLTGENSQESIVVPSFTSVGTSSRHFKLKYTASATEQVLDLTKGIKVYDTVDGELKLSSSTAEFTNADFVCADETKNDSIDTILTFDAGKVSISTDELDDYKIKHSTAANYPMITMAVTVNNVSLSFDIEFVLYSGAKTTVANNDSVDVADLLGVEKSTISTVAVTNAYATVNDSFAISFDTNAVDDYFDENPNEEYLVLDADVTKTSGDTFEFEIWIKNPNL